MARQAQYPDQVVVLVSREVGAELRDLGEKTGLGISDVTRQCIDEGLPAVRTRLKSQIRKAARTAS